MQHYHFFLYIDRCEMKNEQPLLLFSNGDSCLFYLCMLVWNETNFLYEVGHSIAHSIFKTSVQCSVVEQQRTHVVEEAKFLSYWL